MEGSDNGEAFLKQSGLERETINNAYFMAMESMATLNRTGATLMRKYGSHGATDVTGFGILGHAENLAAAQRNEVDLIIDRLPVLEQMEQKIEGMPDFKVREGYSAETSGGIFAMVDAMKAEDFVNECEQEYGQKAWIIGEVVRGSRQASVRSDADIISVSDSIILR